MDPMFDVRTTTLGSADFSSRGKARCVRSMVPKTLTSKVWRQSLRDSEDPMMPALLIRMSRRPWVLAMVSRADSRVLESVRSIWRDEMDVVVLVLAARSLVTASAPRAGSRAPMRMVYGVLDWERSRAVWKPMPWLAPVGVLVWLRAGGRRTIG